MAEQAFKPRDIVEMCLEISKDANLQWVGVAQLCAVMRSLEIEIGAADLVRTMKALGAEVVSRDTGGERQERGYYQRQFVELMNAFQAEDEEKAQEAHGHDLNECASRLKQFLIGLDPDYGLLMGFLQDERGFDDATAIASMCSYVLQNRLHMVVPRTDIFDSISWSPMECVCEICQETYTMTYPGQPPVCLNSACGREYHRRRKEAEEAKAAAQREALEGVAV